jgi:hypothetical protein
MFGMLGCEFINQMVRCRVSFCCQGPHQSSISTFSWFDHQSAPFPIHSAQPVNGTLYTRAQFPSLPVRYLRDSLDSCAIFTQMRAGCFIPHHQAIYYVTSLSYPISLVRISLKKPGILGRRRTRDIAIICTPKKGLLKKLGFILSF